MNEARFELWLPAEQAYTREPPPAHTRAAVADEQAHADLHARRPRSIPGDHGRPASRSTYTRLRRIHTISPAKEYL